MSKDMVIVPCECAGRCTIAVFQRFHWAAPDETFIELYTRIGDKSDFRYRLKQAWNILWGKDHYLDAICISKEDELALIEWLQRGWNSE